MASTITAGTQNRYIPSHTRILGVKSLGATILFSNVVVFLLVMGKGLDSGKIIGGKKGF